MYSKSCHIALTLLELPSDCFKREIILSLIEESGEGVYCHKRFENCSAKHIMYFKREHLNQNSSPVTA